LGFRTRVGHFPLSGRFEGERVEKGRREAKTSAQGNGLETLLKCSNLEFVNLQLVQECPTIVRSRRKTTRAIDTANTQKYFQGKRYPGRTVLQTVKRFPEKNIAFMHDCASSHA
ncbi:unnamed protein product, partial [Ectocarpus sp. 12 AP-2014]